MRIWPFGRDKEEGPKVEYASRVVTAKARDQREVRAKVTVSFAQERSSEEADAIADAAATSLRELFAADDADALIVAEQQLAERLADRLRTDTRVRAVEIVALHVVGGSTSDGPQPSRRPLSEPPLRGFSAPNRSLTPAAPRRSSSSSSQLLAVRDSRLIPEGASAEAAALAIVPLMRDALTRVLVGTLRAYDLVLVRNVDVIGASADDFGEIVPVSSAAPGRFADERRPELARWEDHLGPTKLARLRNEAAAIVCNFLHRALAQAGVASSTGVALLEAAAQAAFPDERALATMPRYVGAPDPTEVMAREVLDIAGESHARLAGLSLALTPVLASLREDFAFTATQIKLSGIGEGRAPA